MDRGTLVETATLFGSILVVIVALFVPITFGVVLAQRWLGEERLRRWLGGERRWLAVAKGLALGAMTPFCGCSTIPLLAGLLQARVRFAAVTAFFMASPLLNPYILAVVGVLFGVRPAAAYAGFAALSSAVVAVSWEQLGLQRWVRPHLRTPVPIAGGSGDAATCGDATCNERPAVPPWRGGRAEAAAAWTSALAMFRPMITPVVVGVVIGAAIYGAVPEGALAGVVASAGPMAIPVAAVIGIPLYVRGEAAFPIGAGLLAAGVPTAPMLALVVGAEAASLPEVMMLRGLFTWRLLAAYLVTILAVAIGAALLLPPIWN